MIVWLIGEQGCTIFYSYLSSHGGRSDDRPLIMKSVDPFYKTAKWCRIRSRVLRRDGYMCQISKRYGKRRQADTVHHIFPRDKYPEYQYADWNLIALSSSVHDTLHDRVTGELSAKGMELLRRTARQRGIQYD